MRWILSSSLVFNCDCNQGSCVVTLPAMQGRTLGGCWGLSLTLKSFCVSEWSIKGSARCTLLPDVLSSSELLSCLSHYTELLTEVRSKTLRVQWQKAFLGSPCTQSMPRFSDPLVLVSVLVSQSGDAVRTLFSPQVCTWCRQGCSFSGWLTSFQVSLSFPFQRSTDVSAVHGNAPRGHYSISIHGLLPCLYHQHDFCWCWCF